MGEAGGEDSWAAAHLSQGRSGMHAQLPGLAHDEVAYLMFLEMRPHVLRWIELRGVGGSLCTAMRPPVEAMKVLTICER